MNVTSINTSLDQKTIYNLHQNLNQYSNSLNALNNQKHKRKKIYLIKFKNGKNMAKC